MATKVYIVWVILSLDFILLFWWNLYIQHYLFNLFIFNFYKFFQLNVEFKPSWFSFLFAEYICKFMKLYQSLSFTEIWDLFSLSFGFNVCMIERMNFISLLVFLVILSNLRLVDLELGICFCNFLLYHIPELQVEDSFLSEKDSTLLKNIWTNPSRLIQSQFNSILLLFPSKKIQKHKPGMMDVHQEASYLFYYIHDQYFIIFRDQRKSNFSLSKKLNLWKRNT